MTLGTAGTLEGLPEDDECTFENDHDDDYDDEEEEEEDSDAFLSNSNSAKKRKQKNKKKRTSRAIGHSADVKEQIIYDYDIKNYAVEKPMREFRLQLPLMERPIVFNPLTTLIGMIPLWLTTIWCMVRSAGLVSLLLLDFVLSNNSVESDLSISNSACSCCFFLLSLSSGATRGGARKLDFNSRVHRPFVYL